MLHWLLYHDNVALLIIRLALTISTQSRKGNECEANCNILSLAIEEGTWSMKILKQLLFNEMMVCSSSNSYSLNDQYWLISTLLSVLLPQLLYLAIYGTELHNKIDRSHSGNSQKKKKSRISREKKQSPSRVEEKQTGVQLEKAER